MEQQTENTEKSIAVQDFEAAKETFEQDLESIAQMVLSTDIVTVLKPHGDKFIETRNERIDLETQIAERTQSLLFGGTAESDIDFDPKITALKRNLEVVKSRLNADYQIIREKLKIALLKSNNVRNQAVAEICDKVNNDLQMMLQMDNGKMKRYTDIIYRKRMENGYDMFFSAVRSRYKSRKPFTQEKWVKLCDLYQEHIKNINKDFQEYTSDIEHGYPDTLQHPYFPTDMLSEPIETILKTFQNIEHQFLNRLENTYGMQYELLKMQHEILDRYYKKVQDLLDEYIERIKQQNEIDKARNQAVNVAQAALNAQRESEQQE